MSTQAVKNLQVSDLKVGDALPEQSIAVTTTMIVGAAGIPLTAYGAGEEPCECPSRKPLLTAPTPECVS